MTVGEIESLAEVQEASAVLRGLEDRGLREPAIASGWTRAMLTDTVSSDIDVAYVGPVPYQEAQEYLHTVLDESGIDSAPWDIEGIWNAQQAYGVTHTVDNYLFYYVNSIDSVFLTTDGKLHDPTGFGFADAQARLLRINEYDRQNGRQPTPSEEVNVCLEGCRRIARLKWDITPESEDRIARGVAMWERLTDEEKTYFTRKLSSKYEPTDRETAQVIYSGFGWGFIFDLI